MTTKQIVESHSEFEESELKGRYITQKDIVPLLERLSSNYELNQIGVSENNLPIHLIKVGVGAKKILLWSQMHGNESTTTKALFDFFNFLDDTQNTDVKKILEQCTLYIIPMLNPDGAEVYTRVNHNQVDLNRDAQILDQVESRILKKVVDEVKPLVSFNLHGQRTIFSAGKKNNSAIVSFLSPASDKERSITESRKVGMSIIAKMNEALQTQIPGRVGRYDDGFNINCTGDTMESKGYSTILFEAGHYQSDYNREITRKWIYVSLITAVQFISTKEVIVDNYEEYFKIPENEKLFKDIIIKNYTLNNIKVDISIQYQEVLIKNKLHFVPFVTEIANKIYDYGHIEFDATICDIYISSALKEFTEGSKIEYLSINNEKFSVFPINK